MKESNSSEIEIKDVRLEAFQGNWYFFPTKLIAFLQFLYQNEVQLAEPLAMDLYEISDKYLQSELAGLCEDFLSKSVRLNNFIAMIDLIEKFGANVLKAAVLEFIAKNIEEIRKDQSNYVIPPSYLLEMISNLQKKLEKK